MLVYNYTSGRSTQALGGGKQPLGQQPKRGSTQALGEHTGSSTQALGGGQQPHAWSSPMRVALSISKGFSLYSL